MRKRCRFGTVRSETDTEGTWRVECPACSISLRDRAPIDYRNSFSSAPTLPVYTESRCPPRCPALEAPRLRHRAESRDRPLRNGLGYPNSLFLTIAIGP